MKNNRQEEEEEENPDDYCFVCKGGGELIICDYENCPKSYHLVCVGKDKSFLENETHWTCDWHSCFICHKASKYRCFLCPQAQCRRCINNANFVVVKKKKGFCTNCLKLALLVEEDKDVDSDGERVDFEDFESFEGLFKGYWPIFNKKEGFTVKDLRAADVRLKKGLNYNSHADSDNDANDQEKSNRDHKRKRNSKKSNKKEGFTRDADGRFKKRLGYNPHTDSDNDANDQEKSNRDHKRKRNSKKSNKKEGFTVKDLRDYNPHSDSDNDANDQEKSNRDHKRKRNSKKSNKKECFTVKDLRDYNPYSDSDNDANDQEKSNRDHKRKRNSKKSKKKEFIGWGSKSLIQFLESIGKKPSEKLSQHDVCSIINVYIKEKSLIHPLKKKKVICDERLTAVLGRKTVNKHSIYDLLDSHLAENLEKSDEDEVDGCRFEEKTFKKQRNLDKTDEVKVVPKPTMDKLQLVFADIVEENIKLVYLRRSLLEELAKKNDEFEKKVIGSFVRVRSDSKDGIKKYSHQLMQVTGIKKSSSGENNCGILLQVSDMPNDVRISMLSDDNFSQEECKELKQRIKDGLLKKITIDELKQKAKILHEDITKHWIGRELALLQNRIDQAIERGWRRDLGGYLERRKLLETSAEQSRLLKRDPVVIADISGSIPITCNIEDDDEDEKEEKRSPKSILVGSSSKILVDTLEPNQTSLERKKLDEDDEVDGYHSAEKPFKKQRNSNKPDKVKVVSKKKKKKNEEMLNNPQLFFADIVVDNIKLVYLRRSLLEELAKNNDEFEKKVIGSFVRVKSDSKDGIKLYSHQLMQVTGIKKSSFGESDSGILLQVSDTPNDIRISMLSDEDFSEEECKGLKQRIKDGLLKKLTIVELEQKAITLHEDITKHWIARELVLLQNRIDRANEKGWRRDLGNYLEKREVLETSAEKSRLLNKAPIVIPDMSDLEPINDKDENEEKRSPKSILVGGSSEILVDNLEANQTSSGDDTVINKSSSNDGDGNEQATSANNAAKVTGGLVANEKNQIHEVEGAEKNQSTLIIKPKELISIDDDDIRKHENGKKRADDPQKARPQQSIVSSF